MKTQTTMKAIRNGWNKVFKCGYCDLQDIMRYHDAEYYNAGVYGWNCDIYVDYGKDIAITTGYRGMTGKLIPKELIEKYSKIANAIMDDYEINFSERLDELDQNRENFFDELNNL